MEALKMLVFLILIVFTSYPSEAHLGFSAKPRLGLRSKVADSNEYCLCRIKEGPTMADALQGDKKRLVVYLYKDENKNLKVFTPSKEKQLLLPDLKFEKGDKVTNVGSESVQLLFDPDRAIDLNRNDAGNLLDATPADLTGYADPTDENPVQPQAPPSYVLGEDPSTNTNPVDLNSNRFNAENPEGIQNYASFINDPKLNPVIASENGKFNSDILHSLNSPDNNIFPPGNSLFKEDVTVPLGNDKGTFINQGDSDSPFASQINNNRPESTDSNNISFISNSDDKSPVNPNSQDAFPNSLVDETKNQPTEDDNSLSEPANNYVSPYAGYDLPDAFDDIDVPTDDSPKNLVTEPELESGLKLPGIHSFRDDEPQGSPSDKLSVNQVQQLNNLYSTLYEYVTFDKWFDQQMHKIQNTGQSPNKNFDLSSLKQQLEKTLYENGMFVTKDGVLIDSKGEALNVANLKLRPILIGHSVAYDSLFTVKDSDKYEMPSNLPYLEAVLVTLVSPPKILGVIPLGKTYVPRVSYRKEFDYWALKTSNNNIRCPSGKCPKKKFYEWQYLNQYNPSGIRRSSGTKKLTPQQIKRLQIEMQTRSQKKDGRKWGQRNKHTKRNSALNQFLEALQLLDKQIKNNNRVSPATKKNKQKPYDDADVFDEGKDEAEEFPWFRIIGGNPATSSGTPVSSKGRSGRPY